jgi:hypothetical protein
MRNTPPLPPGRPQKRHGQFFPIVSAYMFAQFICNRELLDRLAAYDLLSDEHDLSLTIEHLPRDDQPRSER